MSATPRRPEPAVNEVRRAVRAALRTLPAPQHAAPLLVACSGGADSLALVAAALSLRDDVHAAVVDHGLQDGSAEHAATTAQRLGALGARARVHRVEVTGPGGVEAAARTARYAALRTARPHPDSPVLLGHTLDDQAETVLLGLGRGSGPRSIAGMRAWDEPWLRPLLGVRRATTRVACADLPVWDDPHNTDPRFTRVRLRHEVLPLLEVVLAGGVAAALARTAAQLREDLDALDELAAALGTDATELELDRLVGVPVAVRRRVLRGWLRERGVSGLTDEHLRAADTLAVPGPDRTGAALPGGLELVRERGRLGLRRARWSPTGQPHARRPEPRRPAPVYDGDIASTLVTEQAIREKTAELATLIGKDYAETCGGGSRTGASRDSDLLLIGVLKGAVMFMTDLARALPLPVQLEFMAVSSYGSSTSSSGVVRILKDLDRDIAGRHVLIVEDIIDSGLTLSWLLKNLESRGPASMEVCTLLRKPDAVKVEVPVKYVGFDIPNEFVVGYGLDYAERYRDLPYIGTLDPSVYA